VSVTGLEPGTVTPYRVLVDGKQIAIPKHAAITTPSDDRSEKTRIAFGTCQHRWGIAHRENTSEIMKHKPVAMLMYGDVAVQDRNNDLGMHRADYALRDMHTTWRNLVCSTPVYTSWDDHDYFDNDRWGIPKGYTDDDRRGVRKVWTQAWNNPYYGLGDEGGGIFNHTRIGPCDIIMTDNRYFRTRNGKHCFLGPEQMEWLKKTLLACKGPFIIMSCGTMWSDYVSRGKDSWGQFDREGREEIFKLIEEHKIPGVLLISGDRHGARGFRIPRPSGFEFYEFEPASLGGRSGPAATSDKWTTQLYGFDNKFAFGEFTFDVSKPDPTVTYKLIEATGKTLYELTLKRSQLTPA
jgi:alkaline phosphatase D